MHLNPFRRSLETCEKRTSAGPASEVSGGSDGRESSRRRCHNAGWSPARPEHAAQRRQRCCIAAISRPEHPSPMWAPCRKKMLKDVRVACHAHNPTAPPHPHHPCSHYSQTSFCVRPQVCEAAGFMILLPPCLRRADPQSMEFT